MNKITNWEQVRDEKLSELERTHSADQYMVMIRKMTDIGREYERDRWSRAYQILKGYIELGCEYQHKTECLCDSCMVVHQAAKELRGFK